MTAMITSHACVVFEADDFVERAADGHHALAALHLLRGMSRLLTMSVAFSIFFHTGPKFQLNSRAPLGVFAPLVVNVFVRHSHRSQTHGGGTE